ncbi:CGNR zinc finger domain-containing protein, partial [Nonomuraea lactucae]|uniref:CGNR zinc finger domain-containing protein n=1 Tax=Nonomuraea lactucae TaxID=2249762 RepID=UPI0019656412
GAGDLAAAKRVRAAIQRLAEHATGAPAAGGRAADACTAEARTAEARTAGGLGEWAIDRNDLETLNRAAAAPPPVPVIGAGLERGWAYPVTAAQFLSAVAGLERGWAYPVTAAQFLSAVARDAIDLFSGPLAKRVRMCAGERCYLIFLDTSRPGARRWCSMNRCGNRQKLRVRRS